MGLTNRVEVEALSTTLPVERDGAHVFTDVRFSTAELAELLWNAKLLDKEVVVKLVVQEKE